jgi:hypothetical protein
MLPIPCDDMCMSTCEGPQQDTLVMWDLQRGLGQVWKALCDDFYIHDGPEFEE